MTETLSEQVVNEAKVVPARRKSARGEETRAKINEATLHIIKRDGMRGVRHRAVAKEAGVPLGATTYHFKNIEDLIVSAFIQWRGDAALRGNPIVNRVLDFIEHNARKLSESELGRKTLAREVYQFMVDYEVDQIERYRDDRIIELAFYHESLLVDKLRLEVLDYWKAQLENLMTPFTAMQSPSPIADARITLSIFHQLEREAVMNGDDYDRETLKTTLHRHVCHITGVEFTP
jgi:AcrR family transcriptional regulator